MNQKERREAHMKAHISDVHDYGTLLYIGASPGKQQMVKGFNDAGYKIDVLEAWKENVDGLRFINNGTGVFRKIIHGTAEKFVAGPPFWYVDPDHRPYDVIMWWHGPEHVGRTDAETTLIGLEQQAKHLLIAATPNGVFEQGPDLGNPYNPHVSTWYAQDFHRLGFLSAAIDGIDKKGSHLLAWRRVA